MSLLRPSTRSASYADTWGSGSGTSVLASSAEASLRLIPLYAAVSGIADDVSVTPWHAYMAATGGWGQRLAAQPRLLTDPSGDSTGFIPWMNQGVMSACLWGYAFAPVLDTDRGGTPAVARWVHPGRVSIDETGTRPVFSVDGHVVTDYLYVPGPVLPGSIRGLSPVTLFRMQFGKSLKAQKYASDLFDRGVMPPGTLRNTARTLEPGAAATAKERFKADVANRDIFVTGNDWEWTALTAPADDATFLQTIQAGATEIAAIYRVAPEEIGGTTGQSSLTYTTLEMNQQNRNRRALLPWVRRFESVLSHALGPGQYVKANMDAMIRPDLKARMESHEIALRIGMETNPEGRALEDRPPLTPDEINQWQNLYGSAKAATPEARAREIAELIQKIYLGVGVVLTAEEARLIATQAGADLTAPFVQTKTPAPGGK